jgi:hypothetical protein
MTKNTYMRTSGRAKQNWWRKFGPTPPEQQSPHSRDPKARAARIRKLASDHKVAHAVREALISACQRQSDEVARIIFHPFDDGRGTC